MDFMQASAKLIDGVAEQMAAWGDADFKGHFFVIHTPTDRVGNYAEKSQGDATQKIPACAGGWGVPETECEVIGPVYVAGVNDRWDVGGDPTFERIDLKGNTVRITLRQSASTSRSEEFTIRGAGQNCRLLIVAW